MRTLVTGIAAALLPGVFVGLLAVAPLRAAATAAFAQKEGKACQYCHISASPRLISIDPDTKEKKIEPSTLNARGTYYGEHNHTFDGYVERKVMGASAPPVFHFGWRETLTDAPRRVAVADVTGDHKSRLITLNEKADDKTASILTVKRWDGKAFVTEFTAETHGSADRLEVGKFAGGDRPAVILTSDALWFWNGKTYTHLPSAKPLPLFGITRLRDGTERVLIANSPTDVKAYTVDVKATDGDWLKGGIDAPRNSADVAWGDMHETTDFFDKMHVPLVLSQGGLIGIWDVRKFGKLFLYHARINQDFDVKNDVPGKDKPEFVLKSQSWCVEFVDPTDTSQAGAKRGPIGIYFTPTLLGAVYDIATESAKGDGAPGLLILTSDSGDGKGRSLYFYPLD